MKRSIILLLLLCCSFRLFAWLFPQDAHLQVVMDAAREGCSVSKEKSQTITTKYGKMKTADDTYIAYYPSGNIRLLYLQKPLKIKIKNQNVTINSFQGSSTGIKNDVDIPVEFHENGNIKCFLSETSFNISKYNCPTLEKTALELDENENIISFIPKKEMTITVNKTDYLLDSIYGKPATVVLYSNGNLKNIMVKTTTQFENLKLDFSKSRSGPRMIVSFYESGEIEELGLTNDSLGHPNTFSIQINDVWHDVTSIMFYKDGSCKTMTLNPLQETGISWKNEDKKFLKKVILYKPDGEISAVIGAFKYYNNKNGPGFFYENKCYLIYKNGALADVIQPRDDNEYIPIMFFDDENTPGSYVIENRETHEWVTIDFEK